MLRNTKYSQTTFAGLRGSAGIISITTNSTGRAQPGPAQSLQGPAAQPGQLQDGHRGGDSEREHGGLAGAGPHRRVGPRQGRQQGSKLGYQFCWTGKNLVKSYVYC